MPEYPRAIADVVPHYALERPTHALVLESLERYLGQEEATEIWLAACHLVHVDPEAEQTPAPDLLKAVDALDASDQLVATCATGLRIRLMSYMILADKARTQPASA
jgi:hypothetical protein